MSVDLDVEHSRQPAARPPRRTKADFSVRMRRREASEYLHEIHGISRTPGYLAVLAVKGTGPKYRKDGRIPLYEPPALDEYAEDQLGPPQRSTSERRRRAPADA
jgi:hypothetical protein